MRKKQIDTISCDREFEVARARVYYATSEELDAIDEADRSGVVNDEEVKAALRHPA
jgi:hypothetical protein